MTYTVFGEIPTNVFRLSFARHPQTCVSLLSSTLVKSGSEIIWTAYKELSQSGNTPVSKTDLGGGADVGKDLTLWRLFLTFNLNIGVDYPANRLRLVWTRACGPYTIQRL